MRKILIAFMSTLFICFVLYTAFSPLESVTAQDELTAWTASATGVVDSAGTRGNNRITIFGTITKCDTLDVKMEGTNKPSQGDWTNLNSNGTDTRIVPELSTDDSTFILIYEGYVPWFRLNITKIVGSGASVTFTPYLHYE